MKISKWLLFKIGGLFLVLISACSGSHNQNSNPTTVQQQSGPVSYKKISDAYSTKMFNIALNDGILNSNDICGTIINVAGLTMPTATGLFNFLPYASPALRVKTATDNWASLQLLGNSGNGYSCTENSVFGVASQTLEQNNLIQNADNILISNNPYKVVLEQTITTIHSGDNNSLDNYINSVVGAQGLLANFMNDASIWEHGAVNPDFNIADIAKDTKTLINIHYHLKLLPHLLENLAGVNFQSACDDSGCHSTIQSSPDTLLLHNLEIIKNYLIRVMFQGVTKGDYIDDYNNIITTLYQKVLFATQSLYEIAYLINELNFYHYLAEKQCHIDNFDIPNDIGIPKFLYYFPNFNSNITDETNRYNATQENLSKFFASIINNLNVNALSYIISDEEKAKQFNSRNFAFKVITYGEESTDYNHQLGDIYSSIGQKSGRPLSSINSGRIQDYMVGLLDSDVPNLTSYKNYGSSEVQLKRDWLEKTIFYQYDGIMDISQCVSSVEQGNHDNLPNLRSSFQAYGCSSRFLDKNNNPYNAAILDPVKFTAYYIESQESKGSLSGLAENVLNNCEKNLTSYNIYYTSGRTPQSFPPYDLYWYYPKDLSKTVGSSHPYILCKSWQKPYPDVIELTDISDFKGYKGALDYGGSKNGIQILTRGNYSHTGPEYFDRYTPLSSIVLNFDNGITFYTFENLDSVAGFNMLLPNNIQIPLKDNEVIANNMQIVADDGFYSDISFLTTSNMNNEIFFAVNPGSIPSQVCLQNDNTGKCESISGATNPPFENVGYYPNNFSYKQNNRTIQVSSNPNDRPDIFTINYI